MFDVLLYDALGLGPDMAAGDLLIADFLALYRDEPLQGAGARRGAQQGFDYLNKNDLQRPGDVIFPKSGAGGMSNPEMVIQTIVHPNYNGGNGMTLTFLVVGLTPLASGVARFGLSAEVILANTTGNVYNTNRWGPEVAADVTIDTDVGQAVSATITVAHGANSATLASITGLGAPTAGSPIRFRLRRLNTHANDTANGDVAVVAAFLKQAA